MNYDANLIIEVYIGDVFEFELPAIVDEDIIDMELNYQPMGLLHSEFDETLRSIIISPQLGDTPAFYKPTITLKDISEQSSEYILNIYIRENITNLTN